MNRTENFAIVEVLADSLGAAVEHRAGMQTSKTIVTINKDSKAPIFDLVGYSVVGDLQRRPPAPRQVKTRKG